MTRMIAVGALGLWLCSCTEKTASGPDAGLAQPQPNAFRAPTLKCAFEAPSGWTTSASTLPDQIAEVLATAPKLRGRMVVRESLEPNVARAAEEQKRRTLAAWGNQPNFTLLREDPMGEGRLLAYQWRRQPSAPVERHLIAVLPFQSTVVLAFIDDDGLTPEAHLLATLTTLNCTAK